MDTTRRARQYARSAFTRTYNSLLTEAKKRPQRILELNVAYKLFEEKARNLEVIDQKFLDEMTEKGNEESQVNSEMESADEYRAKFLLAQSEMATLNEAVNKANTPPPSTAANSNVVIQQEAKRNYTLRKIQVQQYGGDLKDFLRFWGQFKIDEDTNMTKDDKDYYLDQYILPGSKASELVNSFPLTGVMYDKIIASLKGRFGRNELLVEYYVRELLKLVLTNAVSNSPISSLTTIYDQLETHIRSLESLGVTTDTCSAMLYPLVESSLPEELLRIWQKQASVSNAAAIATNSVEGNVTAAITSKDRLNNLMRFLQAEVHNEQRISLVRSGFGLHDVKTPATANKGNKNAKREPISDVPSATELLTLREDKTHECIFCTENHECPAWKGEEHVP